MSSFISIFEKEVASTIEGLMGQSPAVSLKNKESLTEFSSIMPPMAVIKANATGDAFGSMMILMPPLLATALADMMVGGSGEAKESMNEDDLDATKEIVSNILGSLSTTMGAQKELPKLSFSVESIEFIDEHGDIDISSYSTMIIFNFSLGSINSTFVLVLDSLLESALFGGSRPTNTQPAVNTPATPPLETPRPVPSMNEEEMKNISLLLDVKLMVRVRIGQKRMLLRDVINMDIGSIIELDQLANEPLDILVEGKKIAEGEVVIVDGNFGVQITNIGSRRETLEKLKT
ncbi:MAG: flagellar motor switch protein FliY [Campylobacterales bacterium]